MPLLSAKEIPENIVVFSQCVQCSGNVDSWVLLPHKVDVTDGEILADDVSSVVTPEKRLMNNSKLNLKVLILGVVPLEPVIEEVVQERHAGLLPEPVLLEDAVRLGAAAGPRAAPSVELAPVEHVGLAHRGQGRRPEPAADVVGLEPGGGNIFALDFVASLFCGLVIFTWAARNRRPPCRRVCRCSRPPSRRPWPCSGQRSSAQPGSQR